MFTHSYNNKLISDLLVECTSIKVTKHDGFPVNICSNCLEKLHLIYDFKVMAAQCEVKLQTFCKRKSMKIGLKLQNQHGNEISSKEEVSAIKHEPIEFIWDHENKLEISNHINSMNSKELSICDPLDLRNEPIKQENQQDEFYEDSEDDGKLSEFESTDEMSKTDCSEDLSKRSTSSGVSTDESDIVMNKKTPEEPVKEVETIAKVEEVLKKPENNVGEIIVERSKPKRKGKNTRLNSPRNVNEKQVELLDNADYKRIMALGLSKKEKSNLPVFCSNCNKTFTFSYFVGVHAHLHTGNLPFKCDKCDVRFPKRPMLKQHLRTHIETKNFACDECGKAFSTIYLLRLHKVIHSTDRPYKCNICSKAFKLSTILQKHLRIHSKMKNHICEVCGKSFIELGTLNNHKLMHQVDV
ncbi:hypothetical protein Trydic_g19580 [Trypoxylus dichotomus]